MILLFKIESIQYITHLIVPSDSVVLKFLSVCHALSIGKTYLFQIITQQFFSYCFVTCGYCHTFYLFFLHLHINIIIQERYKKSGGLDKECIFYVCVMLLSYSNINLLFILFTEKGTIKFIIIYCSYFQLFKKKFTGKKSKFFSG